MNESEPAPKPGCKCAVCKCINRRLEREQDLAENYRRYLDGELVLKDNRE